MRRLLLVQALTVAMIGCTVVYEPVPQPGGQQVQYQPVLRVPNVVGLQHSDAERILASLGLRPSATRQHSGQTADTVLTQSPASGANVQPGSAVTLVVSAGVALVAVPNVVGMKPEDAERALAGAGLATGRIVMPKAAARDPVVESQSPVHGERVEPGRAVDLFIAARTAQAVAVPSLRGLHLREAVELIGKAGLTVGAVTTGPNDAIPAGSVSGQSPAPGQSVAKEAAVSLVVSTGPQAQTERVTVPQVVGLSQEEAVDALNKAGLRAQPMPRPQPGGADGVLSQSPAAGAVVNRGTVVMITVPRIPAREAVLVEDVAGWEVFRAVAALKERGLMSVVEQVEGPKDKVVRQSPAPGERVRIGSSVTLFSGIGEPAVPPRPSRPVRKLVPQVINMSLDAARARIEASGFVVGDVTFETGDSGKVLKQTPSERTIVETGTAIALVVGEAEPPARVVRKAVPQVTGMLLDSARARIEASGLVVGEVTFETGDAGKVLKQTPSERTVVEAGTAIALVVGREAPEADLVEVPNLIGNPIGLVRVALQRAGLILGEITYVESDRQERVVAQNPAAREKVARGSTVNVQLGRKAKTGGR